MTGVDLKSATEQEDKKLFIETYGCQMNVADSEVIASIMQMAGYTMCGSIEDADAVFMNTCSIRDNAEQKILNRLEFFYSLKKNKKRDLILEPLILYYGISFIAQFLIEININFVYIDPIIIMANQALEGYSSILLIISTIAIYIICIIIVFAKNKKIEIGVI